MVTEFARISGFSSSKQYCMMARLINCSFPGGTVPISIEHVFHYKLRYSNKIASIV